MAETVQFVKAHVPETLIPHADFLKGFKEKELNYSNPAAQGVQYCNKLFEHERRSCEKWVYS